MANFKAWVEIFSKLATIGIFVLAVFGYFYTVKPKFELDNLKIEMKETRLVIKELSTEIIMKENKVSELIKEVKDSTSNLMSLTEEKKNLNRDLLSLSKNKEKIELELENQLSGLKKEINTKQIKLKQILKKTKVLKKKNDEFIVSLFMQYYIETIEPYTPESISVKGHDIKSNKRNLFLEFKNRNLRYLDKLAPYNILKIAIDKFQYSKDMVLSKNEFRNLKKKIILELKKNKKNLTYNIDSLINLKKSFNTRIKKMEDLKQYNEIAKLHSDFSNEKNKYFLNVDKKINIFLKKISPFFLKKSVFVIA